MEREHADKIQDDEVKWKSSEVREGQILFELEKKAKIIDTLSKLIVKVENARAPFEVISDFLNGVYKENPEIYQRLLECYALTREYEQLEKRSERDLGLREKVEYIFAKLNGLYSDENIQFFGFLSEGVAMLKKKYDRIKRIGENNEIIEDLLEKSLFPEGENKLEIGSIKDIIVGTFGIDVVVEKDYFKILAEEGGEDKKRKIKAFHQPNSFFSIYGEEKDIEDSRRHERVHNVLKGFFPPIIYPFFLIKNGFLCLDKPGEAERAKQAILSFSPSECVDSLHEEMFANIERIEDLLFHSSVSFVNEKRRIGSGTAGNEIFSIMDFLEKRVAKERDEEIKKFCAEFPEKLDKKFDKAALIMRKTLFIGNELDQEFMVHSLLAIIKPTKFHHIETYLKSRCGKERYEGYAAIYDILFQKTISEKGLVSLREIKEEIPENLKERLKEKIREYQNAPLQNGIKPYQNSFKKIKDFLDE